MTPRAPCTGTAGWGAAWTPPSAGPTGWAPLGRLGAAWEPDDTGPPGDAGGSSTDPVPHLYDDEAICGGLCGVHMGRWCTVTAAYRRMVFCPPHMVLVFGRVEGWGRVVEHPLGWRVASARITALAAPLRPSGRLAGICGLPPESVRATAGAVRGLAERLGAGVVPVTASDGPLRDAWVATARTAARHLPAARVR